MQSTTFDYVAADGLRINTYKWMPDAGRELKGILMLVHGSVEHAKRYAHFADFLTKNGFGVYAPDLRGHGVTGERSGQLGHLQINTGWKGILTDLMQLYETIKQQHSGLPLFVFGHSMGSFVVRDLMGNYPAKWTGAIVCGSTLGKPFLAKSMFPMAKILLLFSKQIKPNKLVHGIVFDPLLKPIKNPRTPVDFVSYDPAEVDKYMNDPYCGCTISIGFANEMARGSLNAALPQTIKNTPATLPIFLISGEDDTVGGENGKDVIALYNVLKANGKNVTFKRYKKGRHEILNDYIRNEVMADILAFMEKLV